MPTLLTFILILGLLVFVHELGHFVAARIMGVGVKEFGFGFPPKLWSVRRKRTVYSINWIPVGGFVRLHGEDGEERDAESFTVQKPWRRAVILFAGVVMNFVLAIIIFSIGFMAGLPTDVGNGAPAGAKVRNLQVQVVEVAAGSAAARAGVQVGDSLVSIDGTAITSITQAQNLTRNAGSRTVAVRLKHGNVTEDRNIALSTIPGTSTVGLGVGLVHAGIVSFSFFRALWEGAVATWTSSVAIVSALGQLVQNLVVHQRVGADVTGPVGIAVLTGQVARLGFRYLLQFTALLSINLAIINVLPIPALDGGRLFFLLMEKLRGRPLSRLIEARIHTTGFALLIALIALVTFRDVLRLNVVQSLWQKFF